MRPSRIGGLPSARVIGNEPSAAAVRWVYGAMWLSLLVFAVLVVVGYMPKT